MNRAVMYKLGYGVQELPPYTVIYRTSLPQLPELLGARAVLGTETDLAGRMSVRLLNPGLVVRTLTHGGIFRRVMGTRFVSVQRSLRELEVSAHLISRGIPTPEIVALRLRRRGPFFSMEMISRLIPDSQDLLAFLGDRPADGAEVIRKTGALVRAIHEAGVYHADLHVKNIVLDRDNKPWIIDLDKAYRFTEIPRLLRYKNIRRFVHSLDKWERNGRIQLLQDCRQAFLNGYGA